GNTPGPIIATLSAGSLPIMAFDRTSLQFSAPSDGTKFTSEPSPQAVQLTQTGTGTVTWTAAASVPWLTVSPASGSGPATLSMSVRFDGNLAATQTGIINFTFNGASSAGPISATLKVRPPLAVDKTSIRFGAM